MRLIYKRLGTQGEIHVINTREYTLCDIRTTHPNWKLKNEISDKDPLLCVDCLEVKPVKMSVDELKKLDLDQIYKWINDRYENYLGGLISESEYLLNLDYYKNRLALSAEEPNTLTKVEPKLKIKPVHPDDVKSTSIAGLRAKLQEELT